MPEVKIGLSTTSLSTDLVIEAWERVKDPVEMTIIADEALSRLFSNPNHLWELAHGMSAVGFNEFVGSGGVENANLDKKFFREAFIDGITAATATYWTIRNISPKSGIYIPQFEIPEDFEPAHPSSVFLPDHPNYMPIISRLIDLLQKYSPAVGDYYDPYLAVGCGAQYGAQFTTEILALRHEMVSADFVLAETHLEAGLPRV